MTKKNLLFCLYFLVILLLFIYSFTQVDLNLTLSRSQFLLSIQKYLQQIGYFNRPLSTYFFVSIISILFIFYGIFVKLSKNITNNFFWKLLLSTTVILLFSYNAFSYDFFNYIFYTKIILHYHQNPYLVTALNFPKDPMLSFMHWTHNTYPYGPFWLIMTLPLGFLGFNYFVPTFILFKLFSAACFLGTVYFVGNIVKKINPRYQTLSMILYALNPLVLIESLVSAHNDVLMMFLAILGINLIIEKKWIWGFLALVLSALTKGVTVPLLLVGLVYFFDKNFRKSFISESKFILFCFLTILAAYGFAISRIEIQPWYALWFLPFSILVKPNKYILWLINGFCFGTLLRYVPFLWQGDWNGMANTIKLYVTIITPIVFLFLGFLYERTKKYIKI